MPTCIAPEQDKTSPPFTQRVLFSHMGQAGSPAESTELEGGSIDNDDCFGFNHDKLIAISRMTYPWLGSVAGPWSRSVN